MSGFTRIKRVTDPLDDKAKARIVGLDGSGPDYVSSGSEHSAHGGGGVMSPSLSELFFGFKVDDAGGESPSSVDSDSERESMHESCESIGVDDLIRPILGDQPDAFRRVLSAHVSRAACVFSCLRSNTQMLRRNVMAYLRNSGYNAAVCKTKWESSGGLAAGSYEFIDVLLPEYSAARYLIDLDFASEFEIARPTASYGRLLEQLPRIFVGTGDELKPILKAMSDAARRSLRSRGLLLPPWRKHRFMQNKWLGPYRRTENLFPATFASASPPAKQSYGVKCRAVGFDAAVNGCGQLLFPAAARTR